MQSKLKLVIYPFAQNDLFSIFRYIEEELSNPKAVIDLSTAFKSAFENICYFPESCPLLDNEYVSDKTIRKLIVKSYIAFYRVKGDEVQVLRVLYGMSNYSEIL